MDEETRERIRIAAEVLAELGCCDIMFWHSCINSNVHQNRLREISFGREGWASRDFYVGADRKFVGSLEGGLRLAMEKMRP